jgi:hypothetical protein
MLGDEFMQEFAGASGVHMLKPPPNCGCVCNCLCGCPCDCSGGYIESVVSVCIIGTQSGITAGNIHSSLGDVGAYPV